MIFQPNSGAGEKTVETVTGTVNGRFGTISCISYCEGEKLVAEGEVLGPITINVNKNSIVYIEDVETLSGGISKITTVGMGETINNLYFVTGDFTV